MKQFAKLSVFLFFIFSLSYTGFSQGMAYHKFIPSVSIIHSEVLIYPNPVTENKFFVKSDKLIKKVKIINVLGQTVKTVTNETDIPYNIIVETGNIKKGMYMVQVTLDNGETIINKIIVK